jgi:ABC-type amino acid transport substrate-binding protein
MRRRGWLIPDTFGLVLVGAVLAMLLFGACSARASPTAAPGGSSAAPTGSSSAGLVVPDRIKAAGTLRVCANVDYPPFESYAADGTTPQGLDIDIATEIATRWGVTN